MNQGVLRVHYGIGGQAGNNRNVLSVSLSKIKAGDEQR